MTRTDVVILPEGTVFSFYLLSPAAEQWVRYNVAGERRFSPALWSSNTGSRKTSREEGRTTAFVSVSSRAELRDTRRRRFDVLVVWRFDRLGRNLRHLLTVLEELQALGISFVSLNEGIDLGTPAGRLQLHILAALSEFERARI